MEDLEDFVMRRLPTAERPLMGSTVLVVEDSRFACEAIRLMCLRSGARIRRADCLKAAARHLRMYRPSVVIVDLGLPDGNGLDLIKELSETTPRIDVILGTSGDDALESAAMEAGANGFFAKPVSSLARFQEEILRHLPREVQPRSPRALPDDVLTPDEIALKDDLTHVSELLDEAHDPATMKYVAQFVGGLAVSAGDEGLLSAANAFDAARRNNTPAAIAINDLNTILRERSSASRVV